MSRHCLALLLASLLSLLLSAAAAGPIIVDDAYGNAIFLPAHINAAHLGYSLDNPAVNLSPYTLTVHSATPTSRFHINDAFGQARLSVSESSALGTAEAPVAGEGDWAYVFVVPSTGRLLFNMSYSATGDDKIQVVVSASNPLGLA